MRSPRLRPALWFASLGALVLAQAVPPKFDERVEALFRPPLAEQMALSPDGLRVAYTLQAGAELHVVMLPIDNPRAKITLHVDDAHPVLFAADKEAAQLRFLRWATDDRLVLAPTVERIPLPNGAQIIAPLMAVDYDGANPKTLLEADDFSVVHMPALNPDSDSVSLEPPRVNARLPELLGFADGNRERFIVRVPMEIYHDGPAPEELISLDIRTGKQTHFDPQKPITLGARDGRLPLPAAVQSEIMRELARKFPRRQISLIDWSADHQRVLVSVTGGSDPGRVFVWRRKENLVTEIFRRAPWLNSEKLNDAHRFEFDAANGTHLSGYVAWPNQPRLKPPPLLVVFPSGFPGHAQPEFDPEAQVFADLGFVVLRLNHRDMADVSDAERWALGAAGPDRIAVDDASAAIDWLAARNPGHPFDAKRVATLGRGFGGYLALRALQLAPERFHCALAIEAPADLETWLYPPLGFEGDAQSPMQRDIPAVLFPHETTDWAALSVVAHAETLVQPVLLLGHPLTNAPLDLATIHLRSKLKSLHRPADYLELDPGFALGLPKARAATYRRIEEFLNLNLYHYDVKIGPTKEVK